MAASLDHSSGYEKVAAEFIARRRNSNVGAAQVRAWARSLPSDRVVLDLGCGSGVPIAQVLLEEGCRVYAVDASAAMVAAFKEHFPQARVVCETAEASAFFGLHFDGVVAWGLLFLLAADAQRKLIHRLAAALKPGGSLLFTAPEPACRWVDVMSGLPSVSLGAAAYTNILADAGLRLEREYDDESDNHYYEARRV